MVATPAGLIGFIIVIGGFFLLIWFSDFAFNQITKRLDKKIELYRLGQEGEDTVVQSILQVLDGNWHLFRNVSLPGGNKGDLDLVLVGPPGAWVLEVKNYRGEFRNIGENWEMRQGRKWKKAFKSPSKQSFNNALRLANFLKADKVNIFVNAAVVWANPDSSLTVENPSVAVWQYDRVSDELGNIWQVEKLVAEERKKISDKLSKLCKQQMQAKK